MKTPSIRDRKMMRWSLAGTFAFALVLFWMQWIPSLAGAKEVADPAIRDVVEDELMMDTVVPSQLIDVSAKEGIVILEGTVDNILAKERAARIAETVKGVRSVVNRIHVVPPMLRTDAQIREDVVYALVNDPATDSYEVAVSVKDNVVTLSGTVDSWQEKRLCGQVAKGVKGVTDLQNDIRIDYKNVRPDSEIKAEIERRLDWDVLVDNALIEVTVKDGKVRLTGIVGSMSEKTTAAFDGWVAGVDSVDVSDLSVRKWARDENLRKGKYTMKTDEEIRKAVQDALVYDPRVVPFEILPEVSNGVVTLRGIVSNRKAKQAAALAARHTVGVISVVNRIKVRPGEPMSDEKIEGRAMLALARDPFVSSYAITVDSHNGVLDLYGAVGSYFEKAQAEDIASRVKGVIVVDNNLVVQNAGRPYTYDPYLDDWNLYNYDWYDYRPVPTVRSDLEIKEDIEAELFWSPFVDADQVTVTVDEGVATLKGKVDSWSEYTAAAENAYEGGAVWVDNELLIKPPM